ncbi:hypothetical protein LJ739_02875 [Aestuariibacter halophilus]|uniref:Uncharacterized protein n=1 Tax=Fluctibacter halophilus TaxID=226011 RepID=A0ABS8G3M0_9ALTE|nr:hypothetical protein [Aestuariibacter halophilus]MCC2615187.1 hypothetical protein [Aestuariibacter halophilus]
MSDLAPGNTFVAPQDDTAVRLSAPSLSTSYQRRDDGVSGWGNSTAVTTGHPITLMLHRNDEIRNSGNSTLRVEQ